MPVWLARFICPFDTPVFYTSLFDMQIWYAGLICSTFQLTTLIQIDKNLDSSTSYLCHIQCIFFLLYFAVPESLTNECPGLCGDSDCIEEWKNTTSKITPEDNSTNLACIVGFIKTGDVGNDSLYTIYY